MSNDTEWQRREAEERIAELLEAAKTRGVQKVFDQDGIFEIVFVPLRQSVEELFATPGPISDED